MSQVTDLFGLTGRSALITGATGAFGQMAARTLVDAGAAVTLAGANTSSLEELSAELGRAGAQVAVVARRPQTEEDAAAMVEVAVDAHGGLDLLVTASGINKVSSIVDQPVADFDAVLDANLRGTWLACRAAGRQMLAQGRGGKVLLVSSTRSGLGHPAGYTAYCASKAAVNLLTKTLACEWGPHGINVNAVAPTVFRSDLTEWMFSDDDPGKTVREGFLTRIPLGRFG